MCPAPSGVRKRNPWGHSAASAAAACPLGAGKRGWWVKRFKSDKVLKRGDDGLPYVLVIFSVLAFVNSIEVNFNVFSLLVYLYLL